MHAVVKVLSKLKQSFTVNKVGENFYKVWPIHLLIVSMIQCMPLLRFLVSLSNQLQLMR